MNDPIVGLTELPFIFTVQMADMVKFGILGLGKIAGKFAHDLRLTDGVHLQSVASRSYEKASAFAKAYPAQNSYGNYEDLINDPSVDVIYIATPHVFHYEWAMKCLKAGKAVLCEKPFAMKKSQVQEMIALAKAKKVFLMEAMWSRFSPGFSKVKELIDANHIGKVKLIKADFGFPVPLDQGNRLTKNSLGGGALLDIGIYPLYLSQFLLGKPHELTAAAQLSKDTDRQTCITLKYDGAMAVLYSSLEHRIPVVATIYGSRGVITMHEAFHECRKITLFVDGEEKEFNLNIIGKGYHHEIIEVRDCINNGQIQSKKMSWEDSLDLIELLDETREKIGLHYD